MKKLTKYILGLLLAAAAACTDETTGDNPAIGPTTDDDGVQLTFTVRFPEVPSAATRSLEDVPNYGNIDLWCVVFQGKGTPSSNFLVQPKRASFEQPPTNANGLEIPFTVSLPATDENAVIHFIAVPKGLSSMIRELEYGPENVVIPRLITTDGADAYWQRIDLGCQIKEDNREEIDKMVSLISPVPLIRNFAKISVELDAELAQKKASANSDTPFFELIGFYVVNMLDRGTIAPYNEGLGFPPFVESAFDNNGRRVYTPYGYDDLITGEKSDHSKVAGCPYAGIRPNGWKVTTSVPTSSDVFTREPKYVYERPFSTDYHTYLIVAGRYSGESNSVKGSGEVTYYKLDIGAPDSRGLFRFYNLLRNFNYKIIIKNVEADGYASPEDAAAGVIYNNNLSAAIETQHLLSISDGHDMMYVNYTSYVFVNTEPLYLRYRYFIISDNTLDNDDQIFSDKTNPDNVSGVVWNDSKDGCVPGVVINKAERSPNYYETDIMQGTTSVHQVWEEIKITPNTPTAEMRKQIVTLFRPGGLSRTVTLYLSNPFKLSKVETYPGRLDGREDRPSEGVAPGFVSKKGGQELTIFFELPLNLPEAIFPLQFVIESNRQNIENDKTGTIVVQSGTSMFDNVTDPRIQYVKTVTWNEYNPENKSDDPYSKDDNYDEYGNYLGNIVRCRFLTITDLDASDINQTETTVLIDNPYFVRTSTTFKRTLD